MDLEIPKRSLNKRTGNIRERGPTVTRWNEKVLDVVPLTWWKGPIVWVADGM